MENLNQIFFREYTALDKLLHSVYSAEQGCAGVTHYLNLLKENDIKISDPNKNYVFKKLRHLRHIRNEMAHEPGAFENAVVKQEDIDFIRSFSQSVKNCQDPLSGLYGRRKAPSKAESDNSLPDGCLTAIIIFAVVMVIACICVGFFKFSVHS